MIHLSPLPRAPTDLSTLHPVLLLLLLLDTLRNGRRAPANRGVEQRADLRHLARVPLALLLLALLLMRLLILRIVLLLLMPIALHQRRDRRVVRVVRRERLHLSLRVGMVPVVDLRLRVVVRGGHRREAARPRGRRARRGLEGRRDERAALVWKLVWTGARVRAFEETTLVAELDKNKRVSIGHGEQRRGKFTHHFARR